MRYFQIFICIVLLLTTLSELLLNTHPCQLCLYQRLFWILILIVCFVKTKTSLLLCCILLLGTISVGFYQFLTQVGFINTICNINFNNLNTPCNTFDIYLFGKGISFALINALIGFFSLIYLTFNLTKKHI